MIKKKYIVFLVLASIILWTSGCTRKVEPTIQSDDQKFKEEYESLNGKQNDSKKDYVTVDIKEDNHVVYETAEEIIKRLENGTGIIYFGFKECPWCRNAVPVLINSASALGVDSIYYYDASAIRDQKELNENGEIITKKEGTESYYKIVSLLKDHLGAYEGLNDASIKRLYFPTVVFVKEGEILGVHVGTVDSQKDPYQGLSKEEEKELSKIYKGYMHQILSDVCDKNC